MKWSPYLLVVGPRRPTLCRPSSPLVAQVRIAASVLTKAAMDRGSKDNITVLIIDLTAGDGGGGGGAGDRGGRTGGGEAPAGEEDEPLHSGSNV